MRRVRLISQYLHHFMAALISTTLVHAQVGTLQIIKAIYGKAGNDVTQRLQKMIKNNTLDVKVTNITM